MASCHADGYIAYGAAPTDKFPIVKGLEKMKSLPQKKRAAPPGSSSSPNDLKIPTFDIDAMLASADAKSERWRPSDRVTRKPTVCDEEDELVVEMLSDHGSRSRPDEYRRQPSPDYFDDAMDVDEDDPIPSLDKSNPTELTDHYLTPHGTDSSTGNPSTITHLSETAPHFSDLRSSSSQVPYSSPALDRARRATLAPDRNSMISPRPVRAVSGDVVKLERMAVRSNDRDYVDARSHERVSKAPGMLKKGMSIIISILLP